MSYLIYVNELGPNYKGESIYEFIFSDTVKDVWGDSWESEPSNGYPSPPDMDFIKKVGVLKSGTLKMSVIQNSDFFCMTDAIDDVIALAWEEDTEYTDFKFDKRLVFRFGDTEENVKNKLYERDKVLEFEKKLSYEEQ